MKTNFVLLKESTKYLLSEYRFKIIVMIFILFNIYAPVSFDINTDYLSGALEVTMNPYYMIAIMVAFMINTINTVNMFEKDYFYILRFENRKKYLIQLTKNIITSNTVVFIVNIVILIICLNVFVPGKFVIQDFVFYGIPNFVYVIFYIFRMFLIIQAVSLINVMLLKLIDYKFVVIMNIILWSTFLTYPYTPSFVVNSLSDIFLMLCDYFSLYEYGSFIFEILCSTIYIIILFLIGFGFSLLAERFTKKIGV